MAEPEYPESIESKMYRIPNIDYSDTYQEEDGRWVDVDGINLRVLLSVAIEELGIGNRATELLHGQGVHNLGHLFPIKFDRLVEMGLNDNEMKILKWQMNEAGFWEGVKFVDELISDEVIRIPAKPPEEN